MRRIPLGNERIKRRLFLCVVVWLALSLLTPLLALFLWMPLIIGEGVLIIAYGILHLITAYKGWDRFYSFAPGEDMRNSYRKRHAHTIISGIFLVLLGVGGTFVLSLVFLGVI